MNQTPKPMQNRIWSTEILPSKKRNPWSRNKVSGFVSRHKTEQARELRGMRRPLRERLGMI